MSRRRPRAAGRIDLIAPTLEVLRAHHARQAERLLAMGHAPTDDDLMFCDAAGEQLWGRQDRWARCSKEVAITLDRYSHALPTLQAKPWHGWTRA